MRNKLLTAGFALTVALLACSMTVFSGFTPKQVSSIEQGMSSKQVKKILGDPVLRDIDGPEEIWTFRDTQEGGGEVKEIRIWFLDGKVIRMKCFEQTAARFREGRRTYRNYHHDCHRHCTDSCQVETCPYPHGYPCCNPHHTHRHGYGKRCH